MENITEFEKGKKYVNEWGNIATYEGEYCGIRLFSSKDVPRDMLIPFEWKSVKEYEEKQKEE